jgi:hypothetical protein
MNNLRFALLSAAVFTGAFAGIFWGSKGFPVMAMRAAPQHSAVATQGLTLEEAVQQTAAAPVAAEIAAAEPARRDTDPGRNQMRSTAIQAAMAYAGAPCDIANRTAFLVAASTYGTAMNGAADGFTSLATPPDTEIRKAVQAAFDTGGISKDEFASPARSWIVGMTRPLSQSPAPCATERRADNMR